MNGKFVVIDGIDGTGKSTQIERLTTNLKKAGYEVFTVDFPRHNHSAAYFVDKYLRGKYGSLEEMGPEKSSLFYALDRYDASKEIEQALSQGKVVVADRYVSANLGHQGAKFTDPNLFQNYVRWDEALEFDILEIPEPDLNIILSLDPKTAQDLMLSRDKRSYTDDQLDIHEVDFDYLLSAARAFELTAHYSRQPFSFVACSDDTGLLSRDEIEQKILTLVSEFEGAQTTQAHPQAAPESDNVYLDTSGVTPKITTEGLKYLDSVVTNLRSNVYAFKETMRPSSVAAAISHHLSQHSEDMRVTLLNDLLDDPEDNQSLLKGDISANMVDSAKQLTGVHIVIENASDFLTQMLERGRLVAHLQQSTRYMDFDQKDKSDRYKYFIPAALDHQTEQYYTEIMNAIFQKYSSMVRKLTDYVRDNSTVPVDERNEAWKGATRAQACDAVRPVLPVAAKATVGIFASVQELESLALHLLSTDSQESRDTGQKILTEARMADASFLSQVYKPEQTITNASYRTKTRHALRDIANTSLAQHSTDHEPITLVDVTHRNEFELLPYMLYEQSNLSLSELEVEISAWDYQQKSNAYKAYIGNRLDQDHKPGRALEHLYYTWDVVCDYGIFRNLPHAGSFQWQQLTPRYGYEIPKLVEEAGLADTFEECFDLSYELYSKLQELGLHEEAQYASLMGHKMRCKITYNARQAFHFHESSTAHHSYPGYRKLTGEMYRKLCEVHPLLGEAMQFVNQDGTTKASEQHPL